MLMGLGLDYCLNPTILFKLHFCVVLCKFIKCAKIIINLIVLFNLVDLQKQSYTKFSKVTHSQLST